MTRRNTDEHLRRLEREAARGDPQDVLIYVVARARVDDPVGGELEAYVLWSDAFTTGYEQGRQIDEGWIQSGALVRGVSALSIPDVWTFQASTDLGRTWHGQRGGEPDLRGIDHRRPHLCGYPHTDHDLVCRRCSEDAETERLPNRRRNTDANLRDLERAWVADMDDLEAEARYLVAWERAGFPGRDPRKHPMTGDIVEATTKTSWRRTDEEVRRFEVVSVDPPRTAHDRPPWQSSRVGATVVRRFLGRSVGREFVPAINRADAIPTMSLHSDPFRDTVLLASWRAWARGGVVLRRMPG